jgi:hypothetical protein
MARPSDHKAPGIFGVVFSALLSLVLGVLVAFVYLIVQPVEVLTSAPKEEPAGTVLLLGAPGAGNASWEEKRDALVGGSLKEVTLTESELNAWAGARFEPVKVEEDVKKTSFFIAAATPNFRIEGGLLQVGMVNTAYVYGHEGPLVLQAKGRFVAGAQGWSFTPEEALLGALPLHKIPAVLPFVASRFGANNLPEEVTTVLTKAREISVRADGLTLALP